MTDFVLEMSNVCKTFYGDGHAVHANDHVSFNLKKGEIHALLGENGAGKSTLVGTLFRKPDSGTIKLRGQEIVLKNPIVALKYGLGIARQDLSKSLIERHSIAENILSVSEGFFLSLQTISEKIIEALEKYDLGKINPHSKVGRLSGGEKQRVEILKALITDPEIIILDEPTAMLTPIEIDNLFTMLNSLKKQGRSIVLITHHLEEALDHCDRITILRQGLNVKTLDTKKAMEEWKTHDHGIRQLANLMVGKEVLYDLNKSSTKAAEIVLETINLRVNNNMGDLAVRDINLQLKKNQILGLAGISGNGQTELIEAITNWTPSVSGSVFVRDRKTTNKSVKTIRNLGVAYIPEDRTKALVPDLSIGENLILGSYQDKSRFFINSTNTNNYIDRLIERYNIKTPSSKVPVRTLSGGNKQKVVIARECSIKPPPEEGIILIAENPTFGLDVGTTSFVRNELLKMRSLGAAILLVSNDLTEILSLSDEIAVIYKGEIIGTISSNDATRENVGLMMGGIKPKIGGN